MCENEKVMGVTCDGVFAKYFVAPEVALTKIPDDMDKDLAIFAEPVKCVMELWIGLEFSREKRY